MVGSVPECGPQVGQGTEGFLVAIPPADRSERGFCYNLMVLALNEGPSDNVLMGLPKGDMWYHER